jgi:hypothetical protein
MGRKKVTTTVYLTEEQVAALKELHFRTRVPIAEYIREGIDMVLEKNSLHLPGQVSLFEEVPSEGFGKKRDLVEEYKSLASAQNAPSSDKTDS